jgi:hypothetical protein
MFLDNERIQYRISRQCTDRASEQNLNYLSIAVLLGYKILISLFRDYTFLLLYLFLYKFLRYFV